MAEATPAGESVAPPISAGPACASRLLLRIKRFAETMGFATNPEAPLTKMVSAMAPVVHGPCALRKDQMQPRPMSCATLKRSVKLMVVP
jgi:hypothetical protein